ncbi:MAG: PEP-CTERM sorting domain-containing protein, partial [Planctomycetota bacterium]|nr:PEP-CTERM sorting domain-containing protein [Planctomycetota bacterium]
IWKLNPTGATFDTYMTIGNEAGYTPVIDPKTGDPYIFGWGLHNGPNWGLGTSWVLDNLGFVTIPPAPYGEPDADGRVLVAQFNVADGEHIQGFANIGWGAIGSPDLESITEVFFTSIPAPGTLALLALAGLAGFRRRRR